MPQTVFISYSHKDKVWKDRLLSHLRISERQGLLELWDDKRIATGTEWRSQIENAIDSADAAILLVSPDFLASDFIRYEEIPRMLARSKKKGMRLFPVLVRSSRWQTVEWLASIQILPNGPRPLAALRGDRRDEEMASIAREISDFLASKPAYIPALHQLPASPSDFSGRNKDLTSLRIALAKSDTPTNLCLHGIGGVGKTTLALKLAEELSPDFADGQFFLDLKGVDSQSLTAAEAMAHVIRSYYPETPLPERESELAAIYRFVLHTKSTLLLMDNAAGPEQIEPLIPPAGSLLLVTSRSNFTLPRMIGGIL